MKNKKKIGYKQVAAELSNIMKKAATQKRLTEFWK